MKLSHKIGRKTWFPIKWWRTKRKKLKESRIRPSQAVLELKWELEGTLLQEELIRNVNQINILNAQLDILNWLLYGETNIQTDEQECDADLG